LKFSILDLHKTFLGAHLILVYMNTI